jgi:DNA-binding CsgD family transcriptional regulator
MQDILQNMRKAVEQQLPAGLVDDNIEIFYQGNQVYAIIGGSTVLFDKWPEWLYKRLEADLNKYPIAIQSLIELGLEQRQEMLWQYARCRFGSYDGNPDIDANGQMNHTEYWDCGFRGQCPHEGRLCASMKVKNGILTPREIDITRLIAEDYLTKEIADELNISETTVPVHLQNISRKIGGSNRRGNIIKFALAHNIIRNK